MAHKSISAALVACALLLSHPVPSTAQPGYVVTTFDVPGSFLTQAYGINEAGQIVGTYAGGTVGGLHGFLLSGGSYSTLDPPGPGVFNVPRGINGLGQVVGYVAESTFGPTHGFLFSGGNYTPIDVPIPSVTLTRPHGINDSGQIVGDYGIGRFGSLHGFLRSGDTYTTIDVPGSSFTEPLGINNSGQIVGISSSGSFLLSGGIYTMLDVRIGFGINNLGQIIGSEDGHGVVFSDGVYTTFDVPGSVSTFANGINDLGQVVGYYSDKSDRQHGFLATPTPEPASLVLLGIGLLGLIGYGCHRRKRDGKRKHR